MLRVCALASPQERHLGSRNIVGVAYVRCLGGKISLVLAPFTVGFRELPYVCARFRQSVFTPAASMGLQAYGGTCDTGAALHRESDIDPKKNQQTNNQTSRRNKISVRAAQV